MRITSLAEIGQQSIPQVIFLTTGPENRPKISNNDQAIDDIMRNYPKTISITLFLLTTAIASADQMTYTISGTGSGYVDAQPFTNATFTLTEFADPATITNQTPSGPAVYSTQPSKQTLWVALNSVTISAATNATAFVNQTTSTAGIWQAGQPEILTVANPVFGNYDLSTGIGPVSGTTFAYASPIALENGQSIRFTSVSGVTFTAHREGNGSQLSTVSMTPSSGNVAPGASQTYTFVFADTLGATDLQGADILFQNPGQGNGSSTYDPVACWVYVNLATKSLSTYSNQKWSAAVPIGGSTLQGNECIVNTAGAAISTNQNQLSITLPVTFNPPASATLPWTVQAVAFNQNASTEYQKMGTVTVAPAAQPSFTLTATPNGPQALAPGPTPTSVSYTVNVVPSGGFNDEVTFSRLLVNNQDPNEFAVSFNPPTVTGAGSTTMTISTTASSLPISTYMPFLAKTGSGYWAQGQTGKIFVTNAAPAVAVSPGAGTGASQTIRVTATDPADALDISGVNLLIAPTLDGRNACWIYSDGRGLWLATDDGMSWMYAGALGSSTVATNSQCTIGGPSGFVTPDPKQTPPIQTLTLAIPVAFRPSFAGGKTVYVRASNFAALDSGYQTVGTWSVP